MSGDILVTHGALRFILAAGVACSGTGTAPETGADATVAQVAIAPVDTTAVPPTRLQMQNVDFYVDPAIPLRIRRLSGTIRSKTGGPVLFDDKRSFVIGVEA